MIKYFSRNKIKKSARQILFHSSVEPTSTAITICVCLSYGTVRLAWNAPYAKYRFHKVSQPRVLLGDAICNKINALIIF